LGGPTSRAVISNNIIRARVSAGVGGISVGAGGATTIVVGDKGVLPPLFLLSRQKVEVGVCSSFLGLRTFGLIIIAEHVS
jgi:hypothetical protein